VVKVGGNILVPRPKESVPHFRLRCSQVREFANELAEKLGIAVRSSITESLERE
jgi:hypothetical protein